MLNLLDARLDKDAQAVVPRWSHNPEEMLVDQAEYELARIPLTSISLVTARTIKVNAVQSGPGCGEVERALTWFVSTLWHASRWNRIRSWNAI